MHVCTIIITSPRKREMPDNEPLGENTKTSRNWRHNYLRCERKIIDPNTSIKCRWTLVLFCWRAKNMCGVYIYIFLWTCARRTTREMGKIGQTYHWLTTIISSQFVAFSYHFFAHSKINFHFSLLCCEYHLMKASTDASLHKLPTKWTHLELIFHYHTAHICVINFPVRIVAGWMYGKTN